MQLIPNDDIHFGDDERHVLVDLLERAINPRNDGSPTWVLPEPGKSTKRRFGRYREIDTGYSAVYSILGPGKRHADDPIVINLNWSTPEPLDEATLRRDVPKFPASWRLDYEVMPGYLAVWIDDARSTTASDLTRFLLDTLLALGAPLPTGRWRVHGLEMSTP
jgi:hypothetical protein